MAFQDYSNTPASNTTIGDSTFIGPNMPRDNVRPALQQLAADGRALRDEMIALGGGGGLPAFLAAGTGAVTRTVQSKMRDVVSVKDFGAVGDGTTNDTAAIQAALDAVPAAGGSVIIPDGSYRAVGLVCLKSNVEIIATGSAYLAKNGNGDLLTLTGDNCGVTGLLMYGDNPVTYVNGTAAAFTGHGLVMTGNFCRVINCGGKIMYGRALKLTGSNYTVRGTKAAWTTTDQTVNGYDIEVGNASTASLYGLLDGIITTQATGGILDINTGANKVVNSQFGKLVKQSIGAPAGSNGGETANNRILGAVIIETSNSKGSGNHFSASSSLTFQTGSAAHNWDSSNTFDPGSVITNNGNKASPVLRSIGTAGKIQIRYGDDASGAVLEVDLTTSNGAFYSLNGFMDAGYQKGFRVYNSAGVPINAVSCGSNSNLTFGTTGGYAEIAASATNGVIFTVASATVGFAVKGDGIYAAGNKVIGARQTGTAANATDLATALTLVNDLKAKLVAHGLIA